MTSILDEGDKKGEVVNKPVSISDRGGTKDTKT
jgi:hypothetical protein